MRRAHAASSLILSTLLVLVGVAMVVSALARGGGPAAVGVVLGVVFAATGAARLWLSHRLRAR